MSDLESSPRPRERYNPVEQALYITSVTEQTPPESVVGALNSFLKTQGYNVPESAEWTDKTNNALISYLATNHDKIEDPLIAKAAREFANKNAGSITNCEVGEECSTRGFIEIPEPIVPCNLDAKDCFRG